MLKLKKLKTVDRIRFRPRARGLLIPGKKCPLCGYEIIVHPIEIYNANEAEKWKEWYPEDVFLIYVEQTCTNPECTYDVFKTYEVEVRD